MTEHQPNQNYFADQSAWTLATKRQSGSKYQLIISSASIHIFYDLNKSQ